MADLKISQLTDGNAAQATDEFVVARSGGNFRIDGASVAAAATSVGTLSSLTVSGNLAVDGTTFNVIAADNRVGVGTASPAFPLDIVGSSRASSTIYSLAGVQVNAAGSDSAWGGAHLSVDNAASGASERAYAMQLGASNTLDWHYYNGSSWAKRMTLDASGNLGLGVTPSAWGSSYKAFQFGGGNLASFTTLTMEMMQNAYDSGSGAFKYSANGLATRYQQGGGEHRFFIAPNNTSGAGATLSTFTQAMTLDASGNLGIGASATSPGQLLTLRPASGNFYTSFVGSSTAVMGLLFGTSGNTVDGQLTYSNSSQVMTFVTATTERARITSGGYFKASNTGTYVGSTSAYHEMVSDGTGNTLVVRNSSASTNTDGTIFISNARDTTNNTYYIISAYNTGATAFKFRVADSGNVTNTNGSYGTISDAKHKTDIVDAGSQWDDLKAVRFRKFKMKDDPSETVMLGVVAQELEEVSPGLVEEHADTERVDVPVLDEDGNETGETTTETRPTGTTTKTVKSSILLMKAAVALQEAMARIEALEVEVAALKAGA